LGIKGPNILKTSDKDFRDDTRFRIDPNFDVTQNKEIHLIPTSSQVQWYCFTPKGKNETSKRLRWKLCEKFLDQQKSDTLSCVNGFIVTLKKNLYRQVNPSDIWENDVDNFLSEMDKKGKSPIKRREIL
jgi:hypothetical protein